MAKQERADSKLPSKEYSDIMDSLLDKFDNKIEFASIDEVMIRNGISN